MSLTLEGTVTRSATGFCVVDRTMSQEGNHRLKPGVSESEHRSTVDVLNLSLHVFHITREQGLDLYRPRTVVSSGSRSDGNEVPLGRDVVGRNVSYSSLVLNPVKSFENLSRITPWGPEGHR